MSLMAWDGVLGGDLRWSLACDLGLDTGDQVRRRGEKGDVAGPIPSH